MQVASCCMSPHPQVHPSSSKFHIFYGLRVLKSLLPLTWLEVVFILVSCALFSKAPCWWTRFQHGSDCRSDPFRVPVPGVFLRRPGSTSRGPRRVTWQDSSGSSSSWCQGTEIRTCQRRAVNSFRFRLEMFRNVIFSYRVSLLVSYQA